MNSKLGGWVWVSVCVCVCVKQNQNTLLPSKRGSTTKKREKKWVCECVPFCSSSSSLRRRTLWVKIKHL